MFFMDKDTAPANEKMLSTDLNLEFLLIEQVQHQLLVHVVRHQFCVHQNKILRTPQIQLRRLSEKLYIHKHLMNETQATLN